MNKLKIGFFVALGLMAAALVMSGCQRSRYEMGKTIGEPADSPEYTQQPNFQPPASTSIH